MLSLSIALRLLPNSEPLYQILDFLQICTLPAKSPENAFPFQLQTFAFSDRKWYNQGQPGGRSKKMIVRLATLADMNACLSLDHDCVTDHVWQMKVHEAESQVSVTFYTVRLPRRMQAAYPRNLEQLAEDWQRGEGFLVAEVDGEVRGYVDLLADPWHQIGWVTNLAVDRGYRRRGIGTALMHHARQWARKQGLQALLVEATTKNYPALCFYQKLGFQFCGFNDHYYPNQDIALFFVRKL